MLKLFFSITFQDWKNTRTFWLSLWVFRFCPLICPYTCCPCLRYWMIILFNTVIIDPFDHVVCAFCSYIYSRRILWHDLSKRDLSLGHTSIVSRVDGNDPVQTAGSWESIRQDLHRFLQCFLCRLTYFVRLLHDWVSHEASDRVFRLSVSCTRRWKVSKLPICYIGLTYAIITAHKCCSDE